MAPPSFWKTQVPFHPWALFLIFLVSNTLLSYGHLPLGAALAVGFLGILLPLAVGLWTVLEKRAGSSSAAFGRDPSLGLGPEWGDPPLWVWTLFLAALVFSRFYRLVSYPSWITGDEGIVASLSASLVRHWDGRLIWGQVQMEPLYLWALGIFFHFLTPSLFSVRLFGAMVSLTTAAAAYEAARRFLPKGASLIFCWLFCLSFLSYMLSRSCLPNTLPLLFQFLVLGGWGRFLKATEGAPRWRASVWLGILTGVGFYTYTNWVSMAVVTGVLILAFPPGSKGRWGYFACFFLLSTFIAGPLLWARFSPGGTAHLRGLWDLGSLLKPDYLIGLFWNGLGSVPLGPDWGGLLNPVASSLVFLGLLVLAPRLRPSGFALGAFLLLILLLPGLLASFFNPLRVTQLVPFLLLPAVAALGALCGDLRHGPWGPACLVLCASSLVDTYHFAGPYTDPRYVPTERQWRNVEFEGAYRTLETLDRGSGPLYVFTEFNTDYDNKTLDVACYPFNLLEDPRLGAQGAQWAALVLNCQYAPYLEGRFPGLRWRPLPTDRTPAEGSEPFGLFLIPLSRLSGDSLDLWEQADGVYRKMDLKVRNKTPLERWEDFLPPVPTDAGKGDPFLTAVYWEKVGFFKFLDGHFIEAAQAYRNAVDRGVPAAHLYYDLGLCLKLQGRQAEAEECMRKASALSMRAPE